MSERIHAVLPRTKRSYRTIAFLLIGAGLVIFINSSGIVNDAMWNALWPLVLIGIGLDLVTEGRQRRRVIAGTLLAAMIFAPIAGMSGLLGSDQAEVESPDGSRVVPMFDDISRLQANIALSTGQLSIRHLNGSHEEAVDLGRDDMTTSYVQQGETGVLTIGNSGWQAQNLALRFREDLPLDLTIDLGAGNASSLDFEDLRLERLNLNVGTGEARIKLPESGPIAATIISQPGGRVEIEIPDDLPARIEIAASMSNVNIDERFVKDGDAYVSEDYSADEENHAVIRIDATAGNVKIR